ncbi:hypothetical protein L1987_59270 [Smallanthus sonchifolius]|uniref:Uncharacterized protein n=1 Tax=Smallanthus sonchifolius TaxID=185202 RepID=A0ACB9D5H6_9ASTR|nr:hypothetical protein L1987_59270 [Smallanthus sonchifolius]
MSRCAPAPTDNAKFRRRSLFQVISHTFFTKKVKRGYMACSTGKFLALLMICGLTYLMLNHASPISSRTNYVSKSINGGIGIKRLLRKPPRLPPRLLPDEVNSSNKSMAKPNMESKWTARQESVQKAFIHA